MTTRRALLGAALTLPATALIGLDSVGDQRHLFHLPLAPETALWRDLVRVSERTPNAAPHIPLAIVGRAGTLVVLKGYALDATADSQPHEFILAANPVGCPACIADRPGMRVRVAMRHAVAATGAALTITGTLALARLNPQLPFAITDAAVV